MSKLLNSILGSILGSIIAPHKAIDPNNKGGIFKALKVTGGHTNKAGDYIFCTYEIDWRSLERNKYAPWGRGKFGGKPV